MTCEKHGGEGCEFKEPLTDRKARRGDTLVVQFQIVKDLTTGQLYTVIQSGTVPPNFPPNTVPQDLTGFTLWMTLKKSTTASDAQAIAQVDNVSIGGISIISAAQGTGQVIVGPQATINFPDGPVKLVYDIQAKSGGGIISTVESGTFTISPDVTRTLTPIVPAAAAVVPQTKFYVNGASGLDTNTGQISAPLKTYLEARRRIAAQNLVLIGATYDVYIQGDLAATDVMLIDDAVGPNGFLNIHGVPNIVRSSTLTGVVAYNQTTGQWDEIQDGTFDFTPYVGNTLVMINTASGPSYCWIAKAIAPGRARVSFLGQRDPTNSYSELIGPASIGDGYQLWQLPYVTNYLENSFCGFNNAPTNQINVEFLHLPIFTARQSINVQHNECLYDGFYQNLPSAITINPCLNVGFGMGIEAYCTTNFGLLLNSNPTLNAGAWVAYGLIMQNSAITMDTATGNGAAFTFEAHHSAWGIGIFDSTNPIVVDYGANLILEGAVWGQGNTGATITMNRGGRTTVVNPASSRLLALTPAAGHDFLIDGYSALPAVDPTTFAVTASRNLTFANYLATVSGGGFQGAVFNPRFPSSGMAGL